MQYSATGGSALPMMLIDRKDTRMVYDTMETQYLRLLEEILDTGEVKTDRTGVGTRGVFGRTMRCDLQKEFPLLTTKKMAWKAIVYELLWFIQGRTDVKWLQDKGVRIWDEWVLPDGTIGKGYGHQWRRFGEEAVMHGDAKAITKPGIDQLANALKAIKETPDSRRIIVTGWNPQELHETPLPPCHTLFQFCVHGGRLSCQLYQRSGDMFLGVPFNIASYALLTSMMAHCAGLVPGEFIHTLGDAHVYLNHQEQVKLQLDRIAFPPPKLWLDPLQRNLFGFQYLREDKAPSIGDEFDISLQDYKSHPAIKAPVAV